MSASKPYILSDADRALICVCIDLKRASVVREQKKYPSGSEMFMVLQRLLAELDTLRNNVFALTS